ncbi:RIP metalloprotease RseP [Sulfitobacter sp. SK012]|uniref:RIP metalloprotease RseP n=1 Tax=Sulfitobacter sp. SK012 TaxID=1389005 RepID=UPI000E0BEC26|nr:RIP metalloprotease RseP [Sulfitobacter sp. SK012]AXI46837.1 RIP metalloprotease RseP [Sulfitobacter sp. SK012]
MDILALIPQFGGLIWTILAFVIALSVIVAVHEYGHYIVGRWTGIKADVFSLGFGPVIYARNDKRGTRWQIAALPFGGYVKFAGDANAASGKDEDAMADVAADPVRLRETMHGAPLWARSLTVAAGPAFNFVMSFAIFAALAMTIGIAKDPLTVGELKPMPVMAYELAPGDTILQVEGEILPDPEDRDAGRAFLEALPLTPTLEYRVLRDGVEQDIVGPHYSPALIGRVMPTSAADVAGLLKGDVITGIDGEPISTFQELKTTVEASDGRPLLLNVWRDGALETFTFAAKVTDEQQADGSFQKVLRIGIGSSSPFEPALESRGIGASLMTGVAGVWAIITNSLSGLANMITGVISTCNMSGPIGIAQVSGAVASQGPVAFIEFIAVLSTAVGLLNLFPIPALDGGHLVFYAYEAVTGKPPSDKALRVLMSVGLALILSLMVFALGNDLFCP